MSVRGLMLSHDPGSLLIVEEDVPAVPGEPRALDAEAALGAGEAVWTAVLHVGAAHRLRKSTEGGRCVTLSTTSEGNQPGALVE